MATINNTIYPPIISTYQKAFVKDSKSDILFNIKFNISEYTDIAGVQTIEVKVKTLEGNTSILVGDYFFKSAKDIIDPITRTGSIDILKKDIKHDANNNIIDMSYGQFYIIQLRLSQDDCTDFTFKENLHCKVENGDTAEQKETQNNFINAEGVLDRFSEWSTMSLIKCIDTPRLTFQDDTIMLSRVNRLSDLSDLKGYLKWENNDNSEFLYSYRFRVYDTDDLSSISTTDFDYIFKNIEPLEDSGIIRTSTASPNFMHFVFKTDFVEDTRYKVYITYETDNEYTETQYFTFYIQNFISSSNLAGAHAKISTFANADKGCAEVALTLDKSYLTVPSQYLVFRRTSSKSNYKLWDDIHTVKITKDFLTTDQSIDGKEYLKYIWNDWTVESGVFYKYCVQEVDLVGNRAEKIIGRNYRSIEDYYKSLLKCEDKTEEILSELNYAENLTFSLYTDVNDRVFQDQLAVLNTEYNINYTEGSGRFAWDGVFVSDLFTIDANAEYKFMCKFLTEQNTNIYFKIINEDNIFLEDPSVYIEKETETEYFCYFSTTAAQKVRLVCLLKSTDSQITENINEENIENYLNYNIRMYDVEVRQLLTYTDYKIDDLDLILDLKDSFIMDKDNTLKLGFDTVVTTITKNRKTTITEAINSKYPFIYRTGKIEYDSYNVEGTISIQGDSYTKFNTVELIDSISHFTEVSRIKLHSDENIFANEQQLFNYKNIYNAYKQFAENYDLTISNDFNIEKMFRQKTEDFLSNGSPKLFKNAELGNKLVVLTDVSFTPKDGTNNMIYTFSATMTEIDDDNVDNYSFYNIIDLLHYKHQNDGKDFENPDSKKFENIVGQYSYISSDEDFDTINILDRINKKYAVQEDNFLKEVDYITKVRIDLSGLNTVLFNDILGEAEINGRRFYISQHYPYLDLNNVIIKSFSLKTSQKNTSRIVIDFLTRLSNQLVYNTEGWTQYAESCLGQEYNYYTETNKNLYENIYYKYYNRNENTEQKLTNINKMLIQAYSDRKMLKPIQDIGIKILDEKTNIDTDDKSYIHFTDKNGIIDLNDRSRTIKRLEYVGMQITPAEDLMDVKDNEFVAIDDNIYLTEQHLFNTDKTNLTEHTIYQVGQLNLAFFFGSNELKYSAELQEDNTMTIDIDTQGYDPHAVSEAINRDLSNETLTLAPTKLDTTKFLYLNENFYKIDKDNCVIFPVWLKITYLFELLTRKKVHN